MKSLLKIFVLSMAIFPALGQAYLSQIISLKSADFSNYALDKSQGLILEDCGENWNNIYYQIADLNYLKFIDCEAFNNFTVFFIVPCF